MNPETLPTQLPTLMVVAEQARRSPVRVKLSLDDKERALLAQTNGLANVDAFAMKATALGMKGRKLRVEGELKADITYTCGVSLKPYPASLCIPFEQFYLGEGAKPPGKDAIDIDPMEQSDTEPLIDGQADLADLAFQLFTLSLDPYPRHPDLAPPDEAVDEDEDVQEASPFAALKDLKL